MPKVLKKYPSKQLKQVKTKGNGGTNKPKTQVYRRDQPNPAKHYRPLTLPHVELKLIQQLASGKYTQRELAREYGVSGVAVYLFNKRHKQRIEQVKADLENEMAGLWIAEKKNRVAHYQAMSEAVDTSIEIAMNMGDVAPYQLVKIKAKLLEAVAGELGQLPARLAQNISAEKITYLIPGIDLEKLK